MRGLATHLTIHTSAHPHAVTDLVETATNAASRYQ